MYSLSILIPSHNGRHHLQRCLPTVCRFAPAGSQIIVVDDASTDGTASWLDECFPQVEVVRLPENRGFCHAVNAGLEHAHGDIVELLNSDTEVCPGWAEAALAHFADPSVGSVAPLVLQLERPDCIDSAGQEYHICGWAQARGYNRSLSPEYLRVREVFGPSGSSGFFRRSALEQTGGMLPEYEAYLEDTDLAFRLRWAGYRCICEPGSRILHRGGGSYGMSERVVRLLARNEEYNFWINLPLPALLLGLLPHLGFVTVRALRKLLSGQIDPYLQGKWQALCSWRRILHRRQQAQSLAAERGEVLRAFLGHGTDILSHGWRWLRRRQCV